MKFVFALLATLNADQIAESFSSPSPLRVQCSKASLSSPSNSQFDFRCIDKLRNESIIRIQHSIERVTQDKDHSSFKQRIQEFRFFLSLVQAHYNGPYAGRGAGRSTTPEEWFASGLTITPIPKGLPSRSMSALTKTEVARAKEVFIRNWKGLKSIDTKGRSSGFNHESLVVFERVRADAVLRIDEIIREDPRILFASSEETTIATAGEELKHAARAQIEMLRKLNLEDISSDAAEQLILLRPAMLGVLHSDLKCCETFVRLLDQRQRKEQVQSVAEGLLALGAGASCLGASFLTGGAAMVACALTSGSFFMTNVEGYLKQQSLESIAFAGVLGRQSSTLKNLQEARQRSQQYLLDASLFMAGGAAVTTLRAARAIGGTIRLDRATVQSIRAFRSANLEATGTKTFNVHNQSFDVIGKLGESSSEVFLVADSKGKRFALKRYFLESKQDYANAYYDVAVTKFYESKGIKVPKIQRIDASPDRLIIVKDYTEGLTLSEMTGPKSPILDPALRDRLRQAGVKESERLSQSVFGKVSPVGDEESKFSEWLKVNASKLHQESPDMRSLHDLLRREGGEALEDFQFYSRTGDAKPGNMILDVNRQDWILFDP